MKNVDAQGDVVPTADNPVTFAVKGSGALIGVDNGDPASHDDYKASSRSAYNGLCLAIVQTTRRPGKITVTASANGLTPSTVDLTVYMPEAQTPSLP